MESVNAACGMCNWVLMLTSMVVSACWAGKAMDVTGSDGPSNGGCTALGTGTTENDSSWPDVGSNLEITLIPAMNKRTRRTIVAFRRFFWMERLLRLGVFDGMKGDCTELLG